MRKLVVLLTALLMFAGTAAARAQGECYVSNSAYRQWQRIDRQFDEAMEKCLAAIDAGNICTDCADANRIHASVVDWHQRHIRCKQMNDEALAAFREFFAEGAQQCHWA